MADVWFSRPWRKRARCQRRSESIPALQTGGSAADVAREVSFRREAARWRCNFRTALPCRCLARSLRFYGPPPTRSPRVTRSRCCHQRCHSHRQRWPSSWAFSRPFVVRLLDQGKNPSERLPRSRHRCVRLSDVLTFQARREHRREGRMRGATAIGGRSTSRLTSPPWVETSSTPMSSSRSR
jgi:hypothetical protein